jgi:hypothetical protein
LKAGEATNKKPVSARYFEIAGIGGCFRCGLTLGKMESGPHLAKGNSMTKIVLAVVLVAFSSTAAMAAEKCCCDKMKAHHTTAHRK